MRALHAFASTSESLTRQTDSDFHYRCSLFPTRGKHQTGHAHTDTQYDSCVVEHRLSGSVFSTLQPFSAPHYFRRPISVKLLAFRQCHQQLRRLPSYELFCQHYSSQLLSRLADDRQIKVPLSFSAFITFEYSLVLFPPTSNF